MPTALLLALLLAVVVSVSLFVAIRSALPRPLSPEEAAVPQVRGFSGARVWLGPQARTAAPATLRARVGQLFTPLAVRADRRAVSKGRPTLEDRLIRADLKMTPQEFILIRVVCMVLLALVGLIRFGPGVQFLLLAVAGYAAPGLWLRFRTSRRLRAFNDQLADILLLLANSMRAGQSFPQAINTIAEKAKEPVKTEFTRVVREMNLGGSVDEGLAHMVKRVGSDDLELVVTAVAINRSAGGNLAEMLEIISSTIRTRVQTKGEINALTAQGRMSAWFITAIPVVLSGVFYFIAPSYFKPMTDNFLGWVMLGAAAVLLFMGNFIIRKVVSIEV